MSRANPRTTHDNAGIAAWRFKLRATIGSYDDCNEFLADQDARDLGPRMIVRRRRDPGQVDVTMYLAVVLYDTEIIRYWPNGTFSVDNGGWNTPTTTARLDAVLPEGWGAYHHKKQLGLWQRDTPRKDHWPLDHGVRLTP